MSNLSSVNQMYIQQALNPQAAQPVQNNPAPVAAPQPQANLSQEPDVFIPSKKSHKKAIIGAGVFVAAAAGLYFLARTGRLSFTGREQGVSGSGSIPSLDEIIKIKDSVLASASSIQEKGETIITQSKELQAQTESIQTAAKKEFDEVLEIVQNGAANNFKETDSIRFVDRTNKKGESIGQKIMEEFEGGKILRRTLFKTDNPEQIIRIEKGIEKISDGERTAESFHYYEDKLYQYARNIEETKTYTKIAEEFNFDSKTDKLSTWIKDYFYSEKERSQGEYVQFFENGDFIWEKDNKEVTDIISGIETTTRTTGEHMSLSYDEKNTVKKYEKGVERITEYHEGGVQSMSKTDEAYDFNNNLLSSWVKDFEMDKDNNQKRAYWMFFNEDSTPHSCAVNSTGPGQQEAYYEF